MKRLTRLNPCVVLCTVCLVLSACAPVRAPMPAKEGIVVGWDPDRWVGTLAQRFDVRRQFQAVYQARWTDSLERIWRAKVLVTAQLPDRMRIEILDSWGQIQGLFVLREPLAQLWVVGEKSLYRSQRSAGLLEKLVGIGLPGKELAPVLLGLPPLDILGAVPPRRLQDGTVVFGEVGTSRELSRRYGLCPDMERICRMEFDFAESPLSILLHYDIQGDDQDVPSSLTFRSAAGLVELSRTLMKQPTAVPSETFDVPPLGDAVRIVEIP